MKNIYQIKISLVDSEPPVWRRFLIIPDTLLPDLHKIIQTVMGWNNSHLHQFRKDNVFYSEPNEENPPGNIDYSAVPVTNLLKQPGDRFYYEYDFGDDWNHLIELEKIVPEEEGMTYPTCLEGAGNCPPEDSGGVLGYKELINILADPNNEEYDDISDWMGDDFDPLAFNLEDVNICLHQENFGCLEMWNGDSDDDDEYDSYLDDEDE